MHGRKQKRDHLTHSLAAEDGMSGFAPVPSGIPWLQLTAYTFQPSSLGAKVCPPQWAQTTAVWALVLTLCSTGRDRLWAPRTTSHWGLSGVFWICPSPRMNLVGDGLPLFPCLFDSFWAAHQMSIWDRSQLRASLRQRCSGSGNCGKPQSATSCLRVIRVHGLIKKKKNGVPRVWSSIARLLRLGKNKLSSRVQRTPRTLRGKWRHLINKRPPWT